MRFAVTAVRCFAVLLVCTVPPACVTHRSAHPQPAPTPLPAVAAMVELTPLDCSPDGELRLLVRLRYSDAAGERVHVPPGGHVDVHASRGAVQWQPRSRFGDPAAIVRLTEPGPLALWVTSDLPRLPHMMRARTDTRAWRLPGVAARALGPRAVGIGWFPRVHAGSVRIERRDEAGRLQQSAAVAAPVSQTRDTAVVPGAHYTYRVIRPGFDPVDSGVDVPPDLPPSSAASVRGKGMWLLADDLTGANTDAMLARARNAGLAYIELRMTYGEVFAADAARRPDIDRFIDGAARSGIAIVAWTVPRAVSFEDLAANVAAASYRTPTGNRIAGLAVDLERGADFLAAADGDSLLADEMQRLREALGPRVLLVATVEDPYLERLPDTAIPYRAIAQYADVLQPMNYWRVHRSGATIAGLRAAFAGSYLRLRELAGATVPINIGGQTADLGSGTGAPPPDHVAASIAAARELGALGETFFDWHATSDAQWAAIAASPWPGSANGVAMNIGAVRRNGSPAGIPEKATEVWRGKRH